MSVQPESLAANSLRDFLLAQLPAKVTAVNATRFATVRARTPGPYTIGASATLGLSVTPNVATFTGFNVPVGVRSTAQMVTTINTAMGATVAAADADDHLVLASPTAPTGGTRSKLEVRGGTATDCNSVFGWDLGGEKELLTALVAPTRKGCRLGLPPQPDFGPAGVLAVIIGKCRVVPVAPGVRRDQHNVSVEMDVLRIEPEEQTSTEAVLAGIRCVREVLLTTNGRQLGRARNGDILRVDVVSTDVRLTPMKFQSATVKISNPWFRGAALSLLVRVFERPDQS